MDIIQDDTITTGVDITVITADRITTLDIRIMPPRMDTVMDIPLDSRSPSLVLVLALACEVDDAYSRGSSLFPPDPGKRETTQKDCLH